MNQLSQKHASGNSRSIRQVKNVSPCTRKDRFNIFPMPKKWSSLNETNDKPDPPKKTTYLAREAAKKVIDNVKCSVH
ncbi:hypothetical protein VNO77_18243 [Canavalia gladiata]|uniref:Uncharacterized protein n=1 Tax=Canavalia gladiata TaxID=3824 RepID=A0AAN9LQF2_CANGL